jgi:hypothetical protein
MRIIAASRLVCAASCIVMGVATAQTPQQTALQGDFDGDGKPDTVQVNRETIGGKERVSVVAHLAAMPGKDLFIVSGPADKPPSVTVLPPGEYQMQAGRGPAKALTLTADNLKIIFPAQTPGCAGRTLIKYWDPKVPAFAGQAVADSGPAQPAACAPAARDPSQLLPADRIPQPISGDFDGDGKQDQVRVVPVSDKMGQIVIELASRPYQPFQIGGYLPDVRTFEARPPGTFKVHKGASETEDLTLATDSVVVTSTVPGREPTMTVHYWSNTDRTRFQGRTLVSP